MGVSHVYHPMTEIELRRYAGMIAMLNGVTIKLRTAQKWNRRLEDGWKTCLLKSPPLMSIAESPH